MQHWRMKAPLILVFAVFTAMLLSSCGAELENTQATSTATTTTTIPSSEYVEGVEMIFLTENYANKDDDIRRAVGTVVNSLPNHLADELREIVVYVVDEPTMCTDSDSEDNKILLGCADNVLGAWVEIISGNVGKYYLYTVAHEFGHIIGGNKDSSGTRRYTSFYVDVYINGDGEPSPTEYGKTNVAEDYAESFTLYLLSKDVLRKRSFDRFEYFEKLFAPPVKEFEPTDLEQFARGLFFENKLPT